MSETTIVLGIAIGYLVVFSIVAAFYELLVWAFDFWPVTMLLFISRETKRPIMMLLGMPVPEIYPHAAKEGPCI